MTVLRSSAGLIAALAMLPSAAVAQESDSSAIHTTLRAFYFNLAHHDWEAIASQVLPAKVVAHRLAPQAMLAAAESPAPLDDAPHCSKGPSDLARITTDGDWAEVSIARCEGGMRGADEFRLLHFEQRWRILYIDLFQPRLRVTAER